MVLVHVLTLTRCLREVRPFGSHSLPDPTHMALHSSSIDQNLGARMTACGLVAFAGSLRSLVPSLPDVISFHVGGKARGPKVQETPDRGIPMAAELPKAWASVCEGS